MQFSASLLPTLQVCCGIAAHRGCFSEEQDPRRSAPFAQTARHDQAITSIVALAAEDKNVMGGKIRKRVGQIIRDSRAGILHELQAGYAVAIGGEPVGLAHLFCGQNFHGMLIMARSVVIAKGSEAGQRRTPLADGGPETAASDSSPEQRERTSTH